MGPLKSSRRRKVSNSPPTSIYDQLYDLNRDDEDDSAEMEELYHARSKKRNRNRMGGINRGGHSSAQKALKRTDYHVTSTGYSGPSIEISSSGHGHYASHDVMYQPECCPLVVDPLTVAALMGFIGAATFFLNTQVTMLLKRKRRRRRRSSSSAAEEWSKIESLEGAREEGQKAYPIWQTVMEALAELEVVSKGKKKY